MKEYDVTFTETYTYNKHIIIDDSEDINEVIHDPLEHPMVRHMTDDEFTKLNPAVLNEYEIKERSIT